MSDTARLFLSPLLAFHISPARLLNLFEAYGEPPPFALGTPFLERARALFGVRAQASFERATDLASTLASPLGETAIRDAAHDLQVRLPKLLSRFDLAAFVIARAASRPRYARLLDRAQLGIGRYAPLEQRFERIGPGRVAIQPLSVVSETLEKHAGPPILGIVCREAESVHIAIIRRTSSERVLGRKEGASTPKPARGIAVDIVQFDPRTSRLSISTESPRELPVLVALLGDAFYADARAFRDGPAFTLKPLSILGSEGLARLRHPVGVTRVRVVECEGDDGDGASHWEKGSNALAAFEQRGGTTAGYLTSAMLRIDHAEDSSPLDVAIRLPHQIAVRPPRFESTARAVLASLGLESPGRLPDDAWSLAPFTHPEWRWRKVVGDEGFERLCREGVLVRTATRMVASRLARPYGWSYIAFPLEREKGKLYAVADDPALRSFTVTPLDMTVWRLDRARLAALLRKELGLVPDPLDEPASEWKRELLPLGLLMAARGPLHVFLLLTAPGRDPKPLLVALRRAARRGQAVVLLPEGRSLGGAMLEIHLSVREFFATAPSAQKVLAMLEAELGQEAAVPAWKMAATGVRLVIAEATQQAWFDGVKLDLGAEGVRLLIMLGRAEGGVVPTKDIERALWPKHSLGYARKAIHRIAARALASFLATGAQLPDGGLRLVEAVGHRGWRIACSFEIR